MNKDLQTKLHALIKSWRERANWLHEKHGKKIPIQVKNVNDAIELCAVELEEVIDFC